MALITDVTASWSSGVTLSADEIWQCRKGAVLVSTMTSPGENDGILLVADGRALDIVTGKTVKYKAVNGLESTISREAV
jgi:hypothetical protein